MEFLIITGLSGAGKSRAADVLEDLDYYCVDNMPVALMPRFAELCMATKGRYERVALVTDVREKDGFDELLKTLDQLKDMDCTCRILYMDADEATLVKRYKESRRRHPLQTRGMSVEEAILQMNLLGHSFFVFRNNDALDAICVVYRRNNGGYGIIETEDDEE